MNGVNSVRVYAKRKLDNETSCVLAYTPSKRWYVLNAQYNSLLREEKKNKDVCRDDDDDDDGADGNVCILMGLCVPKT